MVHNVNEILKFGRNILIENNVEPREARLLLAYSMGISSSDLIRYIECSDSQYKTFIDLVQKRAAGEPFAYLIKEKDFMKLKFNVNKYTLIPREDTEILVEKAIELLNNKLLYKKEKPKVLDMCTGSGCIAISISKYIQNTNIDAVDISVEALQVARENAVKNDVCVNFIQSNLFENVKEKYDMIVSNPPYLTAEDMNELQKEVEMEPKLALYGGEDGLQFYRKIAEQARDYLNEDGFLIFEIGYMQRESVIDILEKNQYRNIETFKDYGDNNRVIVAKL